MNQIPVTGTRPAGSLLRSTGAECPSPAPVALRVEASGSPAVSVHAEASDRATTSSKPEASAPCSDSRQEAAIVKTDELLAHAVVALPRRMELLFELRADEAAAALRADEAVAETEALLAAHGVELEARARACERVRELAREGWTESELRLAWGDR